jgi:hypothetical protein
MFCPNLAQEVQLAQSHKPVLLQPLQDTLQIHKMLFVVRASYQNIINVDKATRQVHQDATGIHEPLECLACIPQPKRHSEKFKGAEGRQYSRLAYSDVNVHKTNSFF